jgi:hypothetical protein
MNVMNIDVSEIAVFNGLLDTAVREAVRMFENAPNNGGFVNERRSLNQRGRR